MTRNYLGGSWDPLFKKTQILSTITYRSASWYQTFGTRSVEPCRCLLNGAGKACFVEASIDACLTFISNLLLDQVSSNVSTFPHRSEKSRWQYQIPWSMNFSCLTSSRNLLLDQVFIQRPASNRKSRWQCKSLDPWILLHRQRNRRSPSRLCALMQSIYRFHPILLNPLAASCASIADSYCPTRRSDLALFASLSPRDQSPCWARWC